MPMNLKPMLASKIEEPFNDAGWQFEIKWDGYRAIAEVGKEVKLYSRNGISFNERFATIAAAFKKEVISVWGNTVPYFGMYPYQTSYEIFDVKKLWCRPCSKIGYDKCPLGHFKCMEKISVDSIVNHVNILLRK